MRSENDAVRKKIVNCVTPLMILPDGCAHWRCTDVRKEKLGTHHVGSYASNLELGNHQEVDEMTHLASDCLLTISQNNCAVKKASTHRSNGLTSSSPSLTLLPPSSNVLRVLLLHHTPGTPINSAQGKAIHKMDNGSKTVCLASVWLSSESSSSQHDFASPTQSLYWQFSLSKVQFQLIILSRQILKYLYWYTIKT